MFKAARPEEEGPNVRFIALVAHRQDNGRVLGGGRRPVWRPCPLNSTSPPRVRFVDTTAQLVPAVRGIAGPRLSRNRLAHPARASIVRVAARPMRPLKAVAAVDVVEMKRLCVCVQVHVVAVVVTVALLTMPVERVVVVMMMVVVMVVMMMRQVPAPPKRWE